MAVNVKITSNTQEFQASMRALSQELKTTDSALSLVSEKAKLFGSTSDLLGAEVDRLSAKLENETIILGKQKEYIDRLSSDQLKLTEAQKTTGTSLAELNNQRREAIASYGAESEEVKALDVSIAELNKEYLILDKQLTSTSKKLANATIRANAQETSILRTTSALDKANAAYKTRHIDNFSKSMENASQKSDKLYNTLSPLSLGIGAVGVASAYSSIKFSTALAKLSTIADTSNVSMSTLKDEILQLSNQTGQSASDVAEAMYQAISAGQSTADAFKFVGTSSKLAISGFTDTASAVHTLSIILNAYGLKTSQVGEVSNDLIRTQNLGITTVQELGEHLGDVIPVAAEAGVNLQEVSAGMVVLTKNGHNTASSVTELKSLFSSLTKTGSQSDKALRKLTGHSFEQLIKKGMSVSDVLNILNKYAKKNGKTLKDLFPNIRAASGALTLASGNGKEFNQVLKEMNKKGNDTNIAFEKMSNTTGFKFKKSLIQLQNASIKLGDALTPVINEISTGISTIAKAISKLSPQQLKLITDVGIGILSFTLFTGVLSKVTGSLATLSKGLSTTIKFFIKGQDGVSSFSKVLTMLLKPIKLIGVGFTKLGTNIIKMSNLLKLGTVKTFKGLQTGVVKSIQLLKIGGIKAFKGLQTGAIKSMKLLKTGTLKAFKGLQTGVVKSMQLLKVGVSKSLKGIWYVFSHSDELIKKSVKGMVNAVKTSFNILKTGMLKTVELIKIGTIKSFNALKTGSLKALNLLKIGAIKSMQGLKNGVIKSMKLLKIGTLKTVNNTKVGVIKAFALMKKGILTSMNAAKSGTLKAFALMKRSILTSTNAISVGFKKMGSVIGAGAKISTNALKILWATMLDNPITMIIAAIALIGVALVECYKHCAWFRNKVNWLWSEVKKIFIGFVNFIKDVFTGDFTGAISFLTTPLHLFMENTITIWNSIKGVFNGIIEFIRGVFTGNWSAAWNGVKEVFSSVFNGIVGIAKNAINSVKSAINFIIGGVNKLSFTVPSWVPGIGGDHFGMHIPYLATGGVLDKPTLAMVGEDGQEAVMPLEKNTGWITELASKIDNRRPLLNSVNTTTTNNYANNDIEKVLDKLQEFIDLNKNKVINIPVILNGKQIAHASSTYNGRQQLLDRRMKGN